MIYGSFFISSERWFFVHFFTWFHVNWFLCCHCAAATIAIASVQKMLLKSDRISKYDIRKIVSKWHLKFVIQLNESNKNPFLAYIVSAHAEMHAYIYATTRTRNKTNKRTLIRIIARINKFPIFMRKGVTEYTKVTMSLFVILALFFQIALICIQTIPFIMQFTINQFIKFKTKLNYCNYSMILMKVAFWLGRFLCHPTIWMVLFLVEHSNDLHVFISFFFLYANFKCRIIDAANKICAQANQHIDNSIRRRMLI